MPNYSGRWQWRQYSWWMFEVEIENNNWWKTIYLDVLWTWKKYNTMELHINRRQCLVILGTLISFSLRLGECVSIIMIMFYLKSCGQGRWQCLIHNKINVHVTTAIINSSLVLKNNFTSTNNHNKRNQTRNFVLHDLEITETNCKS